MLHIYIDPCHCILHSDLLEQSDLDSVTDQLSTVKQKWDKIGGELGLRHSLDDIRRQYSDDEECLKMMVNRQLQRTITTWRNIVDALRSPAVMEPQLANQLEASYCHSELIIDYNYCYCTAV